MHIVPSVPGHPEGLFFTLTDLTIAMAWADVHPTLRLRVRADYRSVPEVIEVSTRDSLSPRWRLWRDRSGRLHVDDWASCSFNLPYPTVTAALDHIAASLAADERPGF